VQLVLSLAVLYWEYGVRIRSFIGVCTGLCSGTFAGSVLSFAQLGTVAFFVFKLASYFAYTVYMVLLDEFDEAAALARVHDGRQFLVRQRQTKLSVACEYVSVLATFNSNSSYHSPVLSQDAGT
jgi:hypothetical protein